MELHITYASAFVVCLGIIGFMLKYVLASKDKTIQDLESSLKTTKTDFNKIENDVIVLKADLAVLKTDLADQRVQLTTAVRAVSSLADINSKIEKQLEVSNIIHGDMRDLLKKLLKS